jgi:hypothetical protein
MSNYALETLESMTRSLRFVKASPVVFFSINSFGYLDHDEDVLSKALFSPSDLFLSEVGAEFPDERDGRGLFV